MIKNNKVILLESGNLAYRGKLGQYKNIYAYSGVFRYAEKLPFDLLDITDYFMSHYKAGKIIDWVYEQYIMNDDAKVLNEIMDDEQGYLVIKKTVIYALGNLLHSFTLANKFKEKYGITEHIDFIPRPFSCTLFQLISKREDMLPEGIDIPKWYVEKMRRRETIRNLIFNAALNLYPIALALVMNIFRLKNNGIKKYRYAVYIWNTGFNLSTPPYRMAFLEDQDTVNQQNTLYVMDKGMSRENLAKIKTTGYGYCYFKEMVRQFSVRKYFKEVYPYIAKAAKKMASINSRKALLTESYLKTLRWYLLWEIFYSHYDVKAFLAIQEAGNIPRVLFQKRHGSRNIFIYMSTTYDPAYREDMNTYIEPGYGFMVYEAIISSYMSINFFKKNNNFIENYVNSGILNSDIVFRLKHDTGIRAKIKRELGISADKTVIGFFDTPIGGGYALYNDQEGYKLINGIYRLLESNDKYYVIYKSRTHSFSETSDVKKEIDRLIEHKRVFYANKLAPHYNAYDLMGLCDLVIGGFFSSVTSESAAGGLKTICYVASRRFDKEVFAINTFPRFCAYEYAQLKEYTEYWLYQCTEDDFRNFQDNYVKRYVDNYCDGRAIKRLHSLLKQYNNPGYEYEDKEFRKEEAVINI